MGSGIGISRLVMLPTDPPKVWKSVDISNFRNGHMVTLTGVGSGSSVSPQLRSHFVKIRHIVSEEEIVSSGVPGKVIEALHFEVALEAL